MPRSQSLAEPQYELHSLGWKAFQDLCVTILSEVLGQSVQTFFSSNDGGRDGAFHGSWLATEAEAFEGSFTVQCKFTAKQNEQLKPSMLSDEVAKAKRLAERGLANTYILMTNSHLKGTTEETLRDTFQAIPGITHFAAFGTEWIAQKIRESSRLRALVPRIYGLGDLSQILDERACDQATEILSALGGDLEKFVITEAHQKSARALAEHGFVLLLGEPAAGKSTIAASLAVGAIDQWGCRAFKIRNSSEFVAHWNVHEPKQLFWVDDAFGATQFDSALTADWNQALSHLMAAIRRGARVVFTSRDYVYKYARSVLKESAFPLLRESHVAIRVNELSSREREQILYNHLRLGNQPKSFLTKVKPFLSGVAAHDDFKPEIARRLGSSFFTGRLKIEEASLDDFVSRPLAHLTEVIRNIDSGSRAALAAVFMRGGSIPSPIDLSEPELKASELIGGKLSDVREGLNALDGGLVIQARESGQPVWKFKHPTVRDAFAQFLADDPELLDVYLAGTTFNRMLQEVCCGDVNFGGAKLVVPESRYDRFIDRILEYRNSTGGAALNGHCLQFFQYRCDDAFMRRLVERLPAFPGELGVGSYIAAVPDVAILARLQRLGLLPDEFRREAAAEMRRLAVDTPDAGCFDYPYRILFTDDELDDLRAHVRAELVECLESTIEDWEHNFDFSAAASGSADPEDQFEPLKDALVSFEKEFADDYDAVDLIHEGLDMIDNVIDELKSQLKEENSGSYSAATSRKTPADSIERSIFDDIDQ